MSGPVARPARSRPWTYEEIILACDLVASNGWRYIDRHDARIEELSDLLRRMSPSDSRRSPTFRNIHGVSRKTSDLATLHPDYQGRPTKGGRHEGPILQAFMDAPERMRELAQAIRTAAHDDASPSTSPPDIDLQQGFSEGRPLERRHLARERDPRARARRIAHSRELRGVIACEACGFDFESTYGDRGRDFIECHHRNPLSVAGPSVTRLSDLALLCSNCHRMIHRSRPWLTVEELTRLLAARTPAVGS